MSKILCIGAHPADCTDLAGGTLYQHSMSGDMVTTVTLTDGIFSHGSHDPIRVVRVMKREEFHKSTKIIGATESLTLGLQDEPLIINAAVIRDLAALIVEQKPDVVITHHPNEYAHWDHAETGKAVCRALKTAIKFPCFLNKGNHWVPTVYFFAVAYRPESTRIGINVQAPTILIDISKAPVAVKVEAMMCFASQGHNNEDKMWERMDSYESEMGRADGLRYSEGFIQYYPLKRYLLELNDDQGFYGGTKE